MKETKAKSKASAEKKQKQEGGDEYAAIAMALYSFLGGLHDRESDIITINRNYQAGSQWCAKIFNMRNLR
ncbi:MAG TPA: hypothetical protein PLP69_05175 [Bacteroidales bacterium]|nr:hypothetical protein [Bacteroidales bacterium]